MLTRFRHRNRDDDGIAMLIVIASVLIMTILAFAAVATATNQTKFSRRDQDFTGASQAAQSGLDDYLARLQANPNYWTVQNGDTTNPAFTGQTPVPGSVSGATFQYAIDTSKIASDGYMVLTSTGKVNNRTRTVTARLTKQSFLDYMYFTQYETIDPVAYATQPPANTCNKYAYTTPSQTTVRPQPGSNNNPAYCANISFATADTLKGPVYSQDKIQLNGSPTFTGTYRTGWNDPAQVYYSCLSGATCNPTFQLGRGYGFLNFPSTNSALRPYADPTVGGQGCVFKGPTNMVFNANGTMTVLSPATPSTTSTGACGTRNWTTAQTFNVPNGQVIWVDANPNSCSAMPAGFPFPISGDGNAASQPTKLRPACGNGDAYVQGWVKGQVTIGTVNNIFVTNSIRYVGSNTSASASNLNSGIPTSSNVSNSASVAPASDTTGSDILGLAAANFVQVYHPLDNNGANVSSGSYPLTNILIDAAIVASSDSFVVSDWDSGPALGVLSVNGAIIQQFRGPVATSSGNSLGTGYAKNYAYDNRLHTLNPPHLADLASSSWISVAQGEGLSN